MPEPANRGLFQVRPGKMTILAVKFFRNYFDRAKHRNERGRQKFPGHLRIFDVRRVALRTANQGSGNVGIGCFPFDHETLRLLEISVVDHNFRVRLRLGHKAELLQGRLVVNIDLESCILETPLELSCFGRIIKRGNRHHKISLMRRGASR